MGNTPKKYDAVMGGRVNIPLYAAVLGGLEGLKRRRRSKVIEERQKAYEKALQYGDRGLDLAIEGLLDPAGEVIWYVYQLLQTRSEAKAKQALIEYNPYQLFECLHTARNEGYYPAAITYTSNNNILNCVYGEGRIYLKEWRSDGNIYLSRITEYNSLDCVIFSRDGNTLVVAKQSRDRKFGEIAIYNRIYPYQNRTIILRGHSRIKESNWLENIEVKSIMSLAISQNGRYLVSGGGDSKIIIRSWNFFTSWQETYHLRSHEKPVTALAIDPESQILASGCYEGKIQLHQLKNGNLLGAIDTDNRSISGLIFTKNGANLISGDLQGNIKIWRSKNLELLDTLEAGDRIRSLNISPDGKLLIACVTKNENNLIQIWDLNTIKKLATLKEPFDRIITSACLSRDRKTIVTQSLFSTTIWGLK